MRLTEKLDKVKSLDSFLEFVNALVVDRRTEGATWQNQSIEGYLEAAAAWARDSREQENGVSEEASWRNFAVFLYCGKIYE